MRDVRRRRVLVTGGAGFIGSYLAEAYLSRGDEVYVIELSKERYWVGSGQNMPWNLRLAEEVGYIQSDTVDGDVRWQVSLTRLGSRSVGAIGRFPSLSSIA